MNQSLTNPLQSLITSAATQQAGGDVTRLKLRDQSPNGPVAILADTSSSMGEMAGGRRKIDILREALAQVWPHSPKARLVAFSAIPIFIGAPDWLQEPSGSTALHLALDAVVPLRPARTLVISDGHPDDAEAAIQSANDLTGQIDVIYCGPEGDYKAIAFLQKLARRTGGQCHVTPQGAGQLINLLEPVRRLLLLND